jgi:hypothetical protein
MRLWVLTPCRQRNVPKSVNPRGIVAASVSGAAARARPRCAFVRGKRTAEPTPSSERWFLSGCYPKAIINERLLQLRGLLKSSQSKPAERHDHLSPAIEQLKSLSQRPSGVPDRADTIDAAAPNGPKPNNRVTKGKLEGQHFALWRKDEAQKANSRDEEPATTSNRGSFRSARRKGEILGGRTDGILPSRRPSFTALGSLLCPS